MCVTTAGEYPADFKEAVHELHISGNVARDANKVKDVDIGKTTGLYNLVLGQGQNVFVGKGNLTNSMFRFR